MASIIEQYNITYKKIKKISDEIQQTKERITSIQDENNFDIPTRVTHLEEQLKKIDEYLLKVQAFRKLAEKHISSKNVLTIEAPSNYRVNLNRLRKWAMLIDPQEEKDDPYAQKVYIVATCDEFFLNKKKKEFEEKIADLNESITVGTMSEMVMLEEKIANLKKQERDLIYSQEFSEFLKAVEEQNKRFWHEKSPKQYLNVSSDDESFAPGAYAVDLPISKDYKELVKSQLGKFYDMDGGRILLPVEIPLDKEFVMTVSCAPSKDRSLDKGIQNLILNVINNSSAGMQKVYVIDGVRFNTSAIGTLKQLENTFALERIPRNNEQITETLEKIVSTFADIDENLGDYDSVKMYNNCVSEDKKIPLTTIVLYGWPNAYEGRNRNLLTKVLTNYERYGISFITVGYKKNEKVDEEVQSSLPEYATHNAIHMRLFPNDCTIMMPDKKAQKFVWYVLNDTLSESYVESVKEHVIEKKVIGSEYIKRYPLDNLPVYEKGKKSLSLPFGVDARDKAHFISFDNENFASYLMGASGSGKSTLLHTLITGIIRNYHPDDVELWLADFKMSEFAQYMDPIPPHVKYILLDESPELIYDLLDKLTEKMMERQKFFMKHRELKKVENVKETYMPVILVILDEFSIMSQAVAESQSYKLKLQNLLAKGRALGIKFIFSSQDFSKGIGGLTSTARDQIQSRIAMKNTFSEIDQTLELSVNMKTEQVKNWMEAIPPHYALMKYRDGENIRVKRVNVMYFSGSNGNAYKPQRQMIQNLNRQLVPSLNYDPKDSGQYIFKSPVIVDGNTFHAFVENEIQDRQSAVSQNEDLSGDELFAFTGIPRLMSNYKEIVITPESRQNFLLLCDSSEYNCGASVVTSLMKCMKYQKQQVSVWTYERNKIYKMARFGMWDGFEIISEMEDICEKIRNLKNELQISGDIEGKFIVLLGFENICADFELLEGVVGKKTNVLKANEEAVEAINKVMVNVADESEAEAKMRTEFIQSLLFDDEDEEDEDDDELEYFNSDEVEQTINETKIETHRGLKQDEESMLYNAKEDLKYIVQHGSRKGIHFLLYLNSYSDLKQTGLKDDFFRHRLSFRIPAEDSKILFGNGEAAQIPEHICLYSDRVSRFSFRPYLHKGISWDGWGIDEDGNVINPLN